MTTVLLLRIRIVKQKLAHLDQEVAHLLRIRIQMMYSRCMARDGLLTSTQTNDL